MHIGIIMDGNRRWAEKNSCSTLQAYEIGANIASNICRYIFSNNLASHLTLWGLSQENTIKRSKEEISCILSCFHKQLLKDWDHMIDNDICCKIIGDKTCFSTKVEKDVGLIEQATMYNEKKLYLAINYSGKEEIIQGINNYIKQQKNDKCDKLSVEKLNDFLYDKNMPRLDMVVRTGDRKSLSGFLMWHSDYAEIFFLKKFWPDFNNKDLKKVLNKFRCSTKTKFGE